MTISVEKIADLLDQHWGSLLIWVGPNDEAVEDIVQQAFVALAAERVAPENPVAWLYATSRNIAINERKSRQRRVKRHRKVARPERQACSLWRLEEAAELADHLSNLPDESREIVVARIWGGLSFEEIAGVVNKSRATVWRHYQQAIDGLREGYGVVCKTKT